MTLPNIFDLCKPRDDVAKGTIADSDYAANLANVLTGRASRDYVQLPGAQKEPHRRSELGGALGEAGTSACASWGEAGPDKITAFPATIRAGVKSVRA